MRRNLGLFTIALLAVPAIPAAFGGWAVITVQDLPAYLEAGKATNLEFTIRQHGRTPMDDRSPSVAVKRAGAGWFGKSERFAATRTQGAGRYMAEILAADTGSVEITIDSDWGSSRVTLMPMRVVRRGQYATPLAAPERGRELFVAKGCVTCHVKSDDAYLGERQVVAVGPNLTGRQFPVDWLAQKLADPARFRVGTGQDAVMPTLGLAQAEIAALVAYVNQQQSARVTVGR